MVNENILAHGEKSLDNAQNSLDFVLMFVVEKKLLMRPQSCPVALLYVTYSPTSMGAKAGVDNTLLAITFHIHSPHRLPP
ncbi:MAG: hypothetical protein EBX99_06050 [Acidimicrobiia bacterium]|nr:hypothetical protein [Acidimicrobiia bacterium]